MTTHLSPLHDLLVEWQRRLRACRESLHTSGEHHPATQLLRIQERVLRYLLSRYAQQPPTEQVHPLVERQTPPPLPRFYWFVPPPLPVEPSSLHPPRSPRVIRAHLGDIHTSLTAPPPSRKPWLFRKRPRTHH